MDRQEILEMLRAGECNVTFTKADGSLRNMRCSRQQEVLEHFPTQGVRQSSPSVIAVIDLDISEWRCFKPETVISCVPAEPVDLGDEVF